MPGNWLPFFSFSIDLFDELQRIGWQRLTDATLRPAKCVLEVFPRAIWSPLGVEPLPAKRRSSANVIDARYRALKERFRIDAPRAPNHDELQALVSAIPGLAFAEGNRAAYALVGDPPRLIDGSWREGFILMPTTAAAQTRPADPEAH